MLSFWLNFYHWLHWNCLFDNFWYNQWWEFLQNEDIFISVNIYNSHPLACWWRWNIGCIMWVESLVHFLHLLLLCFCNIIIYCIFYEIYTKSDFVGLCDGNKPLPESNVDQIDQSRKSHTAPFPYPTIYHFGTEMCTFLFQSGVLWDMGQGHCGICAVGPLCDVMWYHQGTNHKIRTWTIKSSSTFFISDMKSRGWNFWAYLKIKFKVICHTTSSDSRVSGHDASVFEQK